MEIKASFQSDRSPDWMPRSGLLFLIFSFFILIPALFLNSTMKEFEKEFREICEEQSSEKAAELLSHLERSQDTGVLVHESLDRYQKRAGKYLKGRALSPESIPVLSSAFKRHFPEDSFLIWYGADHKLMAVEGDPVLAQGQKRWQALYDTLTPGRRPTAITATLAEGLLKTVMGQLISPSYLRKGEQIPRKVYLKTKMHLFTIQRWKNGSKNLGTLMAFIPIDGARLGWKLERLLRNQTKAEQRDTQIGGYWLSDETQKGIVSSPDLQPGLIFELWKGFRERNETATLTPDFFYRGKLWNRDPDLFLVAGIRRAGYETFVESLFGWMRLLLMAVGFALSAASLAWAWGRLPLSLSLRTKFLTATAALSGIPLATMLLLGLTHSLQMYKNQKIEAFRKLDSVLYNLEQTSVQNLSELESKTRESLENGPFWAPLTEDKLNGFYRKFHEQGLEAVVATPKNEASITQGTSKKEPIVRRFISIVRNKLKFGSPTVEREKSSADFDLLSGHGAVQFKMAMNFFQPMVYGDFSRLMYHSYFKDTDGYETGYYATFWDIVRLRDFLLAKGREKLIRTGILRSRIMAIRTNGDKRKSPMESRRPRITEWLNLVEYTEEPLRLHVSDATRDYLVFARPMKNLQCTGLVIGNSNDLQGPRALTILMLSGLLLLALVEAMAAAHLLQHFLLHPILELQKSLTSFDQGNYQVSVGATAPDELGKLAESFNRMVDGIRQKERMSRFLRRDVVELAATQTLAVERKKVVVSFAGLRSFSRIEESLSPRASMAVMSKFLGLCEESVKKHGGVIDKFIGDTAMAIFSGNSDTDAQRAVLAALDLSCAVEKWIEERRKMELPVFLHGIGIASGVVLAGHVGSLVRRLDYTVIGDTVNLAARLEKQANAHGNPPILVTGEVKTSSGNFPFASTTIGAVRGRKGTLEIFGLNPA